jgi:hypothetical protein
MVTTFIVIALILMILAAITNADIDVYVCDDEPEEEEEDEEDDW